MTGSINVFSPGFRATDSNGDPLPAGVLRFFEAGTSTPKVVYSNLGLSTSLGAVVTCDSAGYPTSNGSTRVLIYTGTDNYKISCETSTGTVQWTHDNVAGADVIPAAVTEALPTTPVVSKTAAYTVLTTDQAKLINANPTGGAFAITLPSAITAGDNFRIGVRHVGTANTVGVVTVLSQTISRAGQNTNSMALTSLGEGVWLVSDGANWHVDSYTPPIMTGGLAFFRATDRLTAPPSSPTPGARYILNGTGTGTWASYDQHDVLEADGNGGWLEYDPQEGWLAYVEDENLYTAFVGTAWADQTGMSAPSSSVLGMLVVVNQQTNGTTGGDASASAWTAIPLNTSEKNSITGASLGSNQVTLPTGNYWVVTHQPFYGTYISQTRFANAGLTKVIYGGTVQAGIAAAGPLDVVVGAPCIGSGFLSVTDATEVFDFSYYVSSARTGGLGVPNPVGSLVETYARVTVLKIDALQGPTGPTGAQGEGLDAAHYYQWSTSTSGDPGSGKIAANNATLASATQIQISQTNASGGDMAGIFGSWDDSTSTSSKGRLRLAKEGAPQNFWELRITGAGTDVGAYWTFPVTPVDDEGTLSNNNDLSLLFIDIGDKGDPGTTVPDISGLTEDTTPDQQADFAILYDTSAGSHKKVKPRNIIRHTTLDYYGSASTDTAKLQAWIAEGTRRSLTLTRDMTLTAALTLPSGFILDGGGHKVTKGFNGTMFTLPDLCRVLGLYIDGEGGSFTGKTFVIAAGNNQRLIDVDVIDSEDYVLDFTANGAGTNFAWIGGSFNRTTASNDSIRLPTLDGASEGIRRFIGLQGNGSAMIDFNGGNVTVLESCAAASVTFRDDSRYVLADESNRIAMTPTIKGSNHILRCLWSAPVAVTVALNTANSIIRIQRGNTLTDNSTTTTNVFEYDDGPISRVRSTDGIFFEGLVGANNRVSLSCASATVNEWLAVNYPWRFNFGSTTFDINSGDFVFNESGADRDFRVESDTRTHALFLDGATGQWGFNQSSPLNTIDIAGSLGRGAPVTKNADFSLAATENWVINDRAATNTVTMPAASSWTGREVFMKTIQAQAVVSAGSNVVPLAGTAAGTAILPATDGAWATLVSDGTNWVIMQAGTGA